MSEVPAVYDVDRARFADLVVEASRHRLVLVDFWAEWCGPCRTLTPILVKLVEEYGGAIALAKVNADEEQDLASEFGVRGLPTVVLVKNAEVVDQFTGAQPESSVRAFLDRHVERDSDRLVAAARAAGSADEAAGLFEQALARDPENHRIHLEYAAYLVAAGEHDAAERVLDLLPADRRSDDGVAGLETRIRFGRRAREAPPAEQVEQAVAGDPGDCAARHDLAALRFEAGNYEAAMEQLLEIVRRDRRYGEDAGRKGLVAMFGLLGNDDPLVSTYRKQLASAMN